MNSEKLQNLLLNDIDKKSYLGLHVSIQPTDEFKNLVDLKHKKLKELER